MSNPVSALQGKAYVSDVTITEAGLRGMIALRGDLSAAKLRGICTKITGVDFPDAGHAHCDGDSGLCWMSPDEVLILLPYDGVTQALAQIAKALSGTHHLASNVSDARAVFTAQGPFVREVIAKLAPVDLSPQAFQTGDFRRSRLGQIAAAFWMSDADRIEVICFRSVADYAFDLLQASVVGGRVGHM